MCIRISVSVSRRVVAIGYVSIHASYSASKPGSIDMSMSVRLNDTSSPECKIIATRYVGPPSKLTEKGQAKLLDLDHLNEMDFAYVKTILTGSPTLLVADFLANRTSPMREGRDIGPPPGALAKNRSCYPRRCGNQSEPNMHQRASAPAGKHPWKDPRLCICMSRV